MSQAPPLTPSMMSATINGRQPRDLPAFTPPSCVPPALALLKNHITKEINKFGVYVSDSTI